MSERMRDYLVKLSILVTGFGAGAGTATVAAPEGPPAELIWCCDGTDGGCVAVEFMADCPGGSWLYVCEWGQSTEASGSDGESGWECLEPIVVKPEATAEVTP
jgi:hypothetical protein